MAINKTIHHLVTNNKQRDKSFNGLSISTVWMGSEAPRISKIMSINVVWCIIVTWQILSHLKDLYRLVQSRDLWVKLWRNSVKLCVLKFLNWLQVYDYFFICNLRRQWHRLLKVSMTNPVRFSDYATASVQYRGTIQTKYHTTSPYSSIDYCFWMTLNDPITFLVYFLLMSSLITKKGNLQCNSLIIVCLNFLLMSPIDRPFQMKNH